MTDASTPEPIEAAIEIAAAAGLIYVSDTDPGLKRRRRGKTFEYLSADNRVIRTRAVIERIAKLAIPPAYEDVWICANPRGHLQATGRDQRRRKQYRYHPQWREARDAVKFDRMIEFGQALPRLRRRVKQDMKLPGLPREKVLATVVGLLDATGARVGNEEYARDNKSFGLSTLRDKHARLTRDGRAVLSFRGKGGIDHEIVVDDKRLARIVRKCQELPGQQLFQYVDDDGQRRGIDSGLVNDYLRETMGAEFTAKDFRTWAATVRAIVIMACTPLPEHASEAALNRKIVAAVKEVARELRNTPAVCRTSYINPEVFMAWRSGQLHKVVTADLSKCSNWTAERWALRFLKRSRPRRQRKSLQ